MTDGYKLDHRRQYPENTEYVYSNWTPRSCHYYPEATEGAVVFGIQYFIKKYRVIQFPDGEPHIILENIDRKDDLSVTCRVCNPTDLFILMQVGDILNRQGVSFILHITYLMSMRMDRVMSYDE